MGYRLFVFSGRRKAMAFWLGCALVTVGVALHLPMFIMAQNIGYTLAGMPMNSDMLFGMAFIVSGIGPRHGFGNNILGARADFGAGHRRAGDWR